MIFSCPLRVLAAVLISMASLSVFAQAPGPKDIDRDRFLSEIRNYKHEVLVKSLELTKEQQREFFPIMTNSITVCRKSTPKHASSKSE